ncbi:hypothetical protein HOE67_04285 [Candidatus Peregrinibacteria bacterium]|nr:hypothetical protein [Candidatus Peregrinibacteria bacterium]
MKKLISIMVLVFLVLPGCGVEDRYADVDADCISEGGKGTDFRENSTKSPETVQKNCDKRKDEFYDGELADLPERPVLENLEVLERLDGMDVVLYGEVVPGEYVADFEVISKYYSLLTAASRLKEAYDMKYEPEVSFEEFSGWYGDTRWTRAYGVEGLGDSTYRFLVDWGGKSGKFEKYRVEMKMHGDKLETISSELVDEMIVTAYGKLDDEEYAYVRSDARGVETLILVTGDGTIIVDELKRNLVDNVFKNISDIEFSRTGRYFTYKVNGIEGYLLRVYDKYKEEIVAEYGTPYHYGFTKYDRYFYTCNEDLSMHGGAFEIYSPTYDFSNYKNLKKLLAATYGEVFIGDCTGYYHGEDVDGEPYEFIKFNLVDPTEYEIMDWMYYDVLEETLVKGHHPQDLF